MGLVYIIRSKISFELHVSALEGVRVKVLGITGIATKKRKTLSFDCRARCAASYLADGRKLRDYVCVVVGGRLAVLPHTCV